PDHISRRGADVPEARLLPRDLRQAHDVAYLRPAARDHDGRREPYLGRRPRALPEAPRRAPRGQLRLGAVALPPPRRALRVGRTLRSRRAHAEAVRVLPDELLPRRRGRRDAGQALRRLVRRRQPRLLDRLPPRRFQVPALRRVLLEASALRDVQTEDPMGQLGSTVRRPLKQTARHHVDPSPSTLRRAADSTRMGRGMTQRSVIWIALAFAFIGGVLKLADFSHSRPSEPAPATESHSAASHRPPATDGATARSSRSR